MLLISWIVWTRWSLSINPFWVIFTNEGVEHRHTRLKHGRSNKMQDIYRLLHLCYIVLLLSRCVVFDYNIRLKYRGIILIKILILVLLVFLCFFCHIITREYVLIRITIRISIGLFKRCNLVVSFCFSNTWSISI